MDREVNYNIRTGERAREIVDGFSTNQRYLRSLVSNVTDNPEYADGLDYRGLLREGHKIRGVANKILNRKGKLNRYRKPRKVDISDEVIENENNLRNALINRNALLYFLSVEELGRNNTSLEDPFLYEQGHALYLEGND